MASKDISIIGKVFSRLTIEQDNTNRGHGRYVIARCECGVVKQYYFASLRAGRTKSCGCLQRESRTTLNVTHSNTRNKTVTRTYATWAAMKQRCIDDKTENYKNYGGRGIEVCERWLIFENFLADMGERPVGKTLDRIESSGNYEITNCRWATPKQQANNMRSNRVLEHDGKSMTIAQWADFTGIDYSRIMKRIDVLNWPVERALTTTGDARRR